MSTTIATADNFIRNAEQDCCWPIDIIKAKPQIVAHYNGSDHTVAAGQYSALAGVYANGRIECLGINGGRYNATTPEEWRSLVRAAVAAGATPRKTARAATAWGAKVSAKLHCGTTKGGLDASIVLTDSFNGSCALSVTPEIIRGRCTNTLRGYAREIGDKVSADFQRGLRKVRHTASLTELIKHLEAGIPLVLAEAEFLDELLARASSVHLSKEAAQIAFDRLFPTAEQAAAAAGKDPGKVTGNAKTQAENRRAAARIACAMECNKMGGPGNLGSLWMGATWLVDRAVDLETRKVSARKLRKNASPDEVMLFGERGRRVEEIREFVQVVLADGRIEEMSVAGAVQAGALDGAQLLEQVLQQYN